MTLLQQIARKRWEAMTKSLRKLTTKEEENFVDNAELFLQELDDLADENYDPLETFYIIVNQS